MCSGSFIDAIKLEGVQDIAGSKDGQQVALGSASGAIYILHNFTVGGILTLVMLNKDATSTSNFQPIRLLDPGC